MRNNIEVIAEAKAETAFKIYCELNNKIDDFKDKLTDLETSNKLTHVQNLSDLTTQHSKMIADFKDALDDLQNSIHTELHDKVYTNESELLRNYKEMSKVQLITDKITIIEEDLKKMICNLKKVGIIVGLLWAIVEILLNNSRAASTVLGWFGLGG